MPDILPPEFGSMIVPQTPVPAAPAIVNPRPTATAPTPEPVLQPVQAQPQPQQPANYEANRAGWQQLLESPEVRAGLLQFAIQALQPQPIGQSPLGGIAQAVGAGGEAAQRVREGQQAEAKSAEEQALEKAKLEEEKRGHTLTYEAALSGQQSREQIAKESAASNITRAQLAMQGKMTPSQQIRFKALSADYAAKAAVDPSSDESIAAYQELLDFSNSIGQPQAGVPGTGAAVVPGNVPTFKDEQEAADAAAAGKIKPGDKIIVNGRGATWQLPGT